MGSKDIPGLAGERGNGGWKERGGGGREGGRGEAGEGVGYSPIPDHTGGINSEL